MLCMLLYTCHGCHLFIEVYTYNLIRIRILKNLFQIQLLLNRHRYRVSDALCVCN